MEALVIAYGEGRNGKSTFWNVIARVLGTYSGNISADMLTVGCRRNVKPELAEAKGKRMLIAAELEEGKDILTLLVDTKLAKNRSEARRLVTQGGVSVNDVKVTDFAKVFTSADFDEDGVLLIKKGKKGYHQIKAD